MNRMTNVLDRRYDGMSVKKYIVYLILIGVLILFVMSANALPVSAYAGELENLTSASGHWLGDTYVDTAVPNGNFGTDIVGFAGNSGVALYRYMIKWDVSGIPDGSIIYDATLFIYTYDQLGTPCDMVVFGSDNVNWDENVVTWNNQPDNKTNFEDRDTTCTSGQWNSWRIDNLVRNHIDNTDNVTIIVAAADESVNDLLYFRTMDYVADTTLRPYVEIHYLAPEIALYNVTLRWEDNNSLETGYENRVIRGYMTNYGYQDNTIMGATLNDLQYPEVPRWIRVYDNDADNNGSFSDNYWRSVIPTLENDNITFYLTNHPTAYDFQMFDITGYYGPDYDGTITFKKYYENVLMTINSNYWDAGFISDVYLQTDNSYQIHLRGRNDYVKAIGDMEMTDDTTREISVYTIPIENEHWIHTDIIWSVTRSTTTGYITVQYEDNTDETTNSLLKIREWHDENIMASSSFDNSNWSYTWTGVDNDNHYIVQLDVTHSIFGSFCENWVVAALGAYTPTLPDVIEIENVLGGITIGASTLTFASVLSFGIVVAIAAGVSNSFAGIGMIMIGLISVFLTFMGWLSIPGGYGLPILITVLGGIWKLTESRAQ